jgi:hypothetical protein
LNPAKWDLPADFPGYDNALIYDKSETGEKKSGVSNVVRTTLSSDVSGIQWVSAVHLQKFKAIIPCIAGSIYGQTSPPCRCTSPLSTYGARRLTVGRRRSMASAPPLRLSRRGGSMLLILRSGTKIRFVSLSQLRTKVFVTDIGE